MATSIDLARRLLGAAENDELMANSLLPVEGVSDAGIGFHCHQAVEKSLKAGLAAKGIDYPFTHNLRYLRELCEKSGIELPSTIDGVKGLNPFALAERYGAEEPLSLDRDQALVWATAAVAWARALIDESSKQVDEQMPDPEPEQATPPS